VPLPPYIRRPDAYTDRERYQCVYARESGSVAAPTAGLHFTEELLERLRVRGIGVAAVVLHVGPGTFRPVKEPLVKDHRVDPEPYEIPHETASAIAATRLRGGRVIAVGTTTTRALESAATADGGVTPGPGLTDLVIVPGTTLRVVDGLVTNFHLPRSSLLLLTAAIVGREALLAAYAEAIRERYRFYSYGDATLIL
jgi:S-adenosylmethionine:tRNA ribosyltransferase-isomerase